MKGIQFVTDSDGKAIAVQIDLEQWGELWEDMYDRMLIEQRKNEATIPWEDVKRELRTLGKLDGRSSSFFADYADRPSPKLSGTASELPHVAWEGPE